MASNKIAASMPWRNITKEGKQLAVAVATKTDKWSRTEQIARSQGPAVEMALANNEKPLPPGTAKVISRDSEHRSSNDPRQHYTMCCYDSKGNFIETIHVPVKK